MGKLLPILMPLFIVAIIIINALAKMKEVQKKQRARPGEGWKELAGAGEIRKYLQQAATGNAATPEKRPGGGETARRAATGRSGGQGFLPREGGPTAGTFAAPGIEPSGRRKARPAPPRAASAKPAEVKRLLVDKPSFAPGTVSGHGTAIAAGEAARGASPAGRRRATGSQRARTAEKAATDAAPGHKGQAMGSQRARTAEKAAAEAGDMRRHKAATRLPELGRSRLRDAIVLAEVLGTPVAFRAPRA